MTAADLDRLDKLRTETMMLRDELRRLRSASEVSAVVNYSLTSGKCGTGDPVANAAVSVADIEREIAERLVEMGDIINTIQEEDLRELFRRRYIRQQGWARIATEMERYSGDWNAPARRMSRARHRCMVKKLPL